MSIFNKIKNTVAAVSAVPTVPHPTPSPTPQSAPAQPMPPAMPAPTGEAFAPINGVSLEQYAELAALMKDTGNDQEKCTAIAAAHGVARPDWEAAMKGWTARMSDTSLQGKVAYAFMPLYQAALDRQRGGAEPASLEQFAHISAEYSFRQDASGQQISYEVVLKENGLTQTQWNEITSYWTPKVNDPSHPASAKFRELVQKESDRIFGIKR
jgi:hypothetical protein